MNAQHQIVLDKLAEVWELATDIRFGQLMANLSVLAEDTTGASVWDIEDEEMIKVLERHRFELSQLRANAVERTA
jgi:hypothetical protein